jgi:hypothetical protein
MDAKQPGQTGVREITPSGALQMRQSSGNRREKQSERIFTAKVLTATEEPDVN